MRILAVLRTYILAIVVFCLGFGATALVCWQLDRMSATKDEERFLAAVDQLHDSIQRRLATYTDMLRATAGMMDAEGPFDRRTFRAFVRRLELQSRYPGILGLGFSGRFPPEELPRLIASQRTNVPEFRVWPDHPRDEYHVILYLEPLDARNRAAIGYDMFTNANRREAMARARDTGLAAASAPVELVQEIDDQKQPGFLIYHPVYVGGGVPATLEARRARLRGFVYSPFRTGDLFSGILGQERQARSGFSLVDAAVPAWTLFHTSGDLAAAEFRAERTLDVAGRSWHAAFFSMPGLAWASSAGLVPIAFWGGLSLSLLFAALVAMQTRARRRLELSELDLADAARRFEQLANSIPQLAWMARPDGWIYWYNDRWYEYTGATPEAMAGWGWQSVHDPALLPAVVVRWNASIATGTPFEMEFPLRRADGTFRWFLTRVVPLRDSRGAILQWFGTNTEVHALREAEQAALEHAATLEMVNTTGAQLAAELDLQRLVQSLTDAGVRLTRAGFGAFFYNVLTASGENYTLYTLSGLPRAAFERFPMPRNTQVFGPTFHGEGIVRSADITQDPQYGQNQPFRGMPEGHPPVRSYLAVPVMSRSGEVLGGLFFGHPEPGRFTAQHERILAGVAAQAAVAIDNARLYNRVQELLESERAARTEAERVNRLKDEFLATLSHELRTPLNAVLGWSHLLQQRALGSDQMEKALDSVVRNVLAQAKLIDDLLDMSRIVSGQLRIEATPLKLADVVEAAAAVVRPGAEAKGVAVTMRFDAVPSVTGDAGRLQQVFWNLLFNAVKFTPSGGQVTAVIREEGGAVVVEVRDTGIGIPREFLPHVFERFRQADGSMVREHGGLGLGLSIVQSLVQLHGGTVAADSPGEGQGATFTVRLPALAAPVGETSAACVPRAEPC